MDLAADGGAPNGAAEQSVAISGDGRFVAFASKSTNLIAAADTTTSGSAGYVRDLCLGSSAPAGCEPRTEMVFLVIEGKVLPSAGSPSISADGRFVAFANGKAIFAVDTCAGSDVSGACVSADLLVNAIPGAKLGDSSSSPAISANGRYVAFVAANQATLGASSILLADTCLGAQTAASCRPGITGVSVSADGSDLAGKNDSPSISGDGRFIGFASTDARGASKILLRDTCLGASANVDCAASTSLLEEEAADPSVSANGRFVSYVSATGSATAGTLNVYDTCYGASTGCVQGSSSSLPFTVDSANAVPMNADGSAIVFSTSTSIGGLPLSGQGDVLLYTPNF